MEKYKVFIRVRGNPQPFVFRVPAGITWQTLIEERRDKLGLGKIPLANLLVTVKTPITTPINEYRIVDGSEVFIDTSTYASDIEDLSE